MFIPETTKPSTDAFPELAKLQEAAGFFAAAAQLYELAGRTEDAARCRQSIPSGKDTFDGKPRGR